MVNQGTILGRVGKIETKPLNSGGSVTNISMATSKRFMKNGEKQEKVTWHNVACFGKTSEIAESYVKVGDMLYIQGEMENQKYTAQDGSERTKSYILANVLTMLPKAKEQKPEPKKTEFNPDFIDDEIPF